MMDAASDVQTHGLRAADALHLASAMASKYSVPVRTDFYFVTADQDLEDAASADNFQVEKLEPWNPAGG